MTLTKALRYTMILILSIIAPIAILLALVSFSSTARNAFIIAVSEKGLKTEKGIAYGNLPRHKLDIYYTRNDNPKAPVAIFYYGGGWTSGNRALYHFVGTALASKGITTIIPDYRLYPEVQFPSFVEDAALSYQWVWKTFVKDTDRPVIVLGHSAGAHISALLAYDKNYLANLDPQITRPVGIVGIAGPYSFDPTTWPTTKEIFSSAKIADRTRPVKFADETSPATLLFHGLEDDTVKLYNAEDLNKALTQSGVESRLVTLDGIGHIGIIAAIAQPFRWRADILEQTVKFIKKFGKEL